jgi:predicted AlkP superfamily pyrophosphatase or phosphodiesterase
MAAGGFSASGLATLATGAYPQLHGIVADRWYDRKSKAPIQARADLLEATTLADELERRDQTLGISAEKSRVFCLGLEEGRTALLAGRARAQVYWMDAQGQFSTRGDVPQWLIAFNQGRNIADFQNKKWMALDGGNDLPPIRTLTSDPRRPGEFITLYQASPFGQDAQFELLRALMTAEKPGQRDTMDFVFVSLGSMELLGYETGSDSLMMDQMVLQLDRQIQSTLRELNTSLKSNYNLIFASAHGAPPLAAEGSRARRVIDGESLARAINKALSDAVDKSGPNKNTYVEKYVYPFLYLNQEVLRKQNIAPRVARQLAAEAALRYPGVAGYYTADGDCSHTGAWRRRFENSFHALRSGDVMLSYEAEAVEDYSAGRGISYGSLYNYDTHVPLMLYGPQFGRKRIERPIQAVDLAPTVANLAGIGSPSSATGELLLEALAEVPDDEHSK